MPKNPQRVYTAVIPQFVWDKANKERGDTPFSTFLLDSLQSFTGEYKDYMLAHGLHATKNVGCKIPDETMKEILAKIGCDDEKCLRVGATTRLALMWRLGVEYGKKQK